MRESQLRLVKDIFSELKDLKILSKIEFCPVLSRFPLTIWLGSCVKSVNKQCFHQSGCFSRFLI